MGDVENGRAVGVPGLGVAKPQARGKVGPQGGIASAEAVAVADRAAELDRQAGRQRGEARAMPLQRAPPRRELVGRAEGKRRLHARLRHQDRLALSCLHLGQKREKRPGARFQDLKDAGEAQRQPGVHDVLARRASMHLRAVFRPDTRPQRLDERRHRHAVAHHAGPHVVHVLPGSLAGRTDGVRRSGRDDPARRLRFRQRRLDGQHGGYSAAAENCSAMSGSPVRLSTSGRILRATLRPAPAPRRCPGRRRCTWWRARGGRR